MPCSALACSIRYVLQILSWLCSPSRDSFKYVHILLVVGSLKLSTVPRTQKCCKDFIDLLSSVLHIQPSLRLVVITTTAWMFLVVVRQVNILHINGIGITREEQTWCWTNECLPLQHPNFSWTQLSEALNFGWYTVVVININCRLPTCYRLL